MARPVLRLLHMPYAEQGHLRPGGQFSSDRWPSLFWGARAASLHVCARVYDLILNGCWLRHRTLATPGSVQAGVATNMSETCLELYLVESCNILGQTVSIR